MNNNGGDDHNGAAGAHHQNAAGNLPHDNGLAKVALGLNGFATGLEQLAEARERIRLELATSLLNRVLYDAFRNALTDIATSETQIGNAMDIIAQEFGADNDRVMFPDEIRTIEPAVRMISTLTMGIHSLLVFNSDELRLDGHGLRYRIQRGLDDLHMALSGFQRNLDLFFSLEPPGFVYEKE